MKKFSITKELQAVSLVATNERERYNLSKVVIKHKKALATDGYILAKTNIDASACQLPSSLIKKAKFTKMWTPQIELSKDEIRVKHFDFSYVVPKREKVEFPETGKIERSVAKNNYLQIALGPDILAKILAVSKTVKANVLKFSFSEDSLNPVKVQVGDVELIVMPIRVSDGD